MNKVALVFILFCVLWLVYLGADCAIGADRDCTDKLIQATKMMNDASDTLDMCRKAVEECNCEKMILMDMLKRSPTATIRDYDKRIRQCIKVR